MPSLFWLGFNFSIFDEASIFNKVTEKSLTAMKKPVSDDYDKKKICFKDDCFDLKIADTAKKRQKGFQGRRSLDKEKGMLFIFEKEDFHSFWMKNTFIPLDIIWLNKNLKVVHIAFDVRPCKNSSCHIITPDKKAFYVLEINGGMAQEIGLEKGKQMKFAY
jgi:hypothetical protein